MPYVDMLFMLPILRRSVVMLMRVGSYICSSLEVRVRRRIYIDILPPTCLVKEPRGMFRYCRGPTLFKFERVLYAQSAMPVTAHVSVIYVYIR